MSSAGRAASSSGCVTRPKGRGTGLRGFAVQIQIERHANIVPRSGFVLPGSADLPLKGPVIEAEQTSTLAILKLETEPEIQVLPRGCGQRATNESPTACYAIAPVSGGACSSRGSPHCGRSDFILPPYNLPGIVQSGAQ
jgi:hypothetical protein